MADNMNVEEKFDCAILNFWCYSNFGAVMTGYALQQALKDMGYSNKLILYMNKANVRHTIEYYNESHFKKFADKYIESTELYEDERLSELNKLTNTFIVGSDQVWRTPLQGFNKWAHYLSFADKNAKKISCAASFGLDEFIGNLDDEVQAKFLLKNFDNISVREDEAKMMCKSLFGVDCDVMIDPVFYIDRSYYDKMTESVKLNLPQEYILTYFLGTQEEDKKLINAYKEKYKLPVINLKVNEITTEEWLYYIKNAKLLITNSFHGVCFSIIFNREFVCVANKNKAYPRFTTILGKTGLLCRATPSMEFEECLDIEKNPIDYNKVKDLLDKEADFAKNWLKNALDAPKTKFMTENDDMLRALSNQIVLAQKAEIESTNVIRYTFNYKKMRKQYIKYRLRYCFVGKEKRRKYAFKLKELKTNLKAIKSFLKSRK